MIAARYVVTEPELDVIVVGAGPGGSAAGYYLARAGRRVLMLDKATFPRDKTCGDALTPRAVAALRDMDVLATLAGQAFAARRLGVVAPGGHMTKVALESAVSDPAHALVIPRLVLDDVLRKHAMVAGAGFEGGVAVGDIQAGADGVEVRGQRRGQLYAARARLAIVATGASTGLLRRIGLLVRMPKVVLAARAYFEGVHGLDDAMQFHFDGVPLPGYGWVFPTGTASANVGAGVLAPNGRARRKRITGRQAYERFVRESSARRMLGAARQVGRVKGFPIRTDFATAPTYGERVLLVGEAAGLVNPLTGEGIDYAMESARTAARHAVRMLERDNFSPASFAAYDRSLRADYQRLFEFSNRVRALGLGAGRLNLLMWWAETRPDLKVLLTRILLGNQVVPERINAGQVARIVLGRT